VSSLGRFSGVFVLFVSIFLATHCTRAFCFQESDAASPAFRRFQEFVRGGEFAAAELMLAETPELAQDDVLMLPWLKLKQGKTEEGISLLRGCVASESMRRDLVAADALQVLADVSVEQAVELGVEWLREQDMSDIRPQVRWLLARLYLRSKKPDVTRTLVEEGLECEYSGDFLREGIFAYVLYLYQAGDPVEALRYFDVLRERVPETRLDPSYQLQWAHIATAAGQPLSALKTLDRLQGEFHEYYESNEVLFRVSKGLAYSKIGSVGDAKSEFIAAIECSQADPTQADIARAKLKEILQDEESQRLAAAASATAAEEYKAPLTNGGSWATSILLLANVVVVIALFLRWMVRRGSTGRVGQSLN
jgi:tetratricopeptide (TPR) repeat protein